MEPSGNWKAAYQNLSPNSPVRKSFIVSAHQRQGSRLGACGPLGASCRRTFSAVAGQPRANVSPSSKTARVPAYASICGAVTRPTRCLSAINLKPPNNSATAYRTCFELAPRAARSGLRLLEGQTPSSPPQRPHRLRRKSGDCMLAERAPSSRSVPSIMSLGKARRCSKRNGFPGEIQCASE